ncbi:tetratricopeptide repeat protein [Sorangium sp. So ce1151]|uniref:tetratricopeptide repeat protein n=1 Tax=Sorangium sp. So ce1151 TaxID=3133332 RepID=UPI003F5D859B
MSMAGSAPALAQSEVAPATAPEASRGVRAQRAQDAAGRQREASRLYDQGVKAANARKWEKARQLILESFQLEPTAEKAANLGSVELHAGKPRDAAEHLAFFLREAKEILPTDRAAAEGMLAEAKAKIGTVTVQVEAGAEVLVDGQPVGTAPLERSVFVEPGSRHFEARKQGTGAASQELQIQAGSAPEVQLTLATSTGPAFQVVEAPAASASVVEQRPVSIVVARPTVGSGNVADTSPSTASPSWRTWGIVGGAGLAVVGVGVGVGFSAAAAANNADFVKERDQLVRETSIEETICPKRENEVRCRDLTDFANVRDRNRAIGIAGFAVGGLAAAGTLALVLWKAERPAQTAQIEPGFIVVPSMHGVLAVGTF